MRGVAGETCDRTVRTDNAAMMPKFCHTPVAVRLWEAAIWSAKSETASLLDSDMVLERESEIYVRSKAEEAAAV